MIDCVADVSNAYLNTNIFFVRASEVEEILTGADDKYKATNGNDSAHMPYV